MGTAQPALGGILAYSLFAAQGPGHLDPPARNRTRNGGPRGPRDPGAPGGAETAQCGQGAWHHLICARTTLEAGVSGHSCSMWPLLATEGTRWVQRPPLSPSKTALSQYFKERDFSILFFLCFSQNYLW